MKKTLTAIILAFALIAITVLITISVVNKNSEPVVVEPTKEEIARQVAADVWADMGETIKNAEEEIRHDKIEEAMNGGKGLIYQNAWGFNPYN